MSTEALTEQFFDHLHRGGVYAHHWTPDTGEFYTHKRTGEQMQKSWSQWFEVGKRPPVHSAWLDKNVYFTPNPVSSIPTTYSDGSPVQQRVYTKTRTNLVCAINCVFSEFDFKDYGDAEAVKEHLWTLPLYPSVLIHSGGGFHGYWLLDETVLVDDTNRRHIQNVQAGWVDLSGGDKNAKDIAHVFRVPGFKNLKPKYGPNYPIVYFSEVDFERLYTFAQIEELTAPLRKDRTPKRTRQSSDGTTSAGDVITAIDSLKRLSQRRRDDYHDWIAVGMALHGLGDQGLELWDDWSQKSTSYEVGLCAIKWDTFSDDGLGLGSLVHWADEDDPSGKRVIVGGVDEMAGFEPMADGQKLVLDDTDSTTQAQGSGNPDIDIVAELAKVAVERPNFTQQFTALTGIKPLIAKLNRSDRRHSSIMAHLYKIYPKHADAEKFLDECGDPPVDNLLLKLGSHDEGNAQCTHARYKGKFLYNDTHGWLQYTGSHWTNDAAESAVERAITETLEARISAAVASGASQYGQLIKDCIPNNRKVVGTKNQMRSLVQASVDSFDVNPDLLNCKNGVVNLRTGEITPHSVEQRFMYCTPVPYKPATDYSKWVQWLTDATSTEDADWLQIASGYSATGHTREEVLFYIKGPSRSGKGTFDAGIRGALGNTLAKAVQFSTFTTDRGKDDQNFDLAPLKPARFIVASESKQHERFNEAKIKQVTGGDSINCAFKHKTHFEYKPQFKIWLLSNHPVNADPDDDAVWGRIRVIEFPNSHLGCEDKTLKEGMQSPQMLEAILAWMVDGAKRWYQLGAAGLPELAKNAAKKQAQRAELDSVQMWIDDCCMVGSGADGKPYSHSTSVLYQSYSDWCKDNGAPVKQLKGFSQALDKKGFTRDRTRDDGRQFRITVGLRLIPPKNPNEMNGADLGLTQKR